MEANDQVEESPEVRKLLEGLMKEYYGDKYNYYKLSIEDMVDNVLPKLREEINPWEPPETVIPEHQEVTSGAGPEGRGKRWIA